MKYKLIETTYDATNHHEDTDGWVYAIRRDSDGMYLWDSGDGGFNHVPDATDDVTLAANYDTPYDAVSAVSDTYPDIIHWEDDPDDPEEPGTMVLNDGYSVVKTDAAIAVGDEEGEPRAYPVDYERETRVEARADGENVPTLTQTYYAIRRDNPDGTASWAAHLTTLDLEALDGVTAVLGDDDDEFRFIDEATDKEIADYPPFHWTNDPEYLMLNHVSLIVETEGYPEEGHDDTLEDALKVAERLHLVKDDALLPGYSVERFTFIY